MELKEGMYIRTKLNDFCNMISIRKIEEIDYEDDNKFWIDDYIIDTFGDEQNKLSEEDVDKASDDITDLIKAGDYVNGVKVTEEMIKMRDEQRVFGLPDKDRVFIDEIKVNNIVTKEQFNSVKYEVE